MEKVLRLEYTGLTLTLFADIWSQLWTTSVIFCNFVINSIHIERYVPCGPIRTRGIHNAHYWDWKTFQSPTLTETRPSKSVEWKLSRENSSHPAGQGIFPFAWNLAAHIPQRIPTFWSLSSNILQEQTFFRLDLLPSSGKTCGGTHLFGPLERTNIIHGKVVELI
jgi:hypothetical protein